MVFELPIANNNKEIFKIGFTGDTEDQLVISPRFLDMNILITHIGSTDFTPIIEENGRITTNDRNHLQPEGCINFIEFSKKINGDTLAVISEFGEEMRKFDPAQNSEDIRIRTSNYIQSIVNNSCKVLPGDIGLKIKFPNTQVDVGNSIVFGNSERYVAFKNINPRIEIARGNYTSGVQEIVVYC